MGPPQLKKSWSFHPLAGREKPVWRCGIRVSMSAGGGLDCVVDRALPWLPGENVPKNVFFGSENQTAIQMGCPHVIFSFV